MDSSRQNSSNSTVQTLNLNSVCSVYEYESNELQWNPYSGDAESVVVQDAAAVTDVAPRVFAAVAVDFVSAGAVAEANVRGGNVAV